jgi:hypothetical protein
LFIIRFVLVFVVFFFFFYLNWIYVWYLINSILLLLLFGLVLCRQAVGFYLKEVNDTRMVFLRAYGQVWQTVEYLNDISYSYYCQSWCADPTQLQTTIMKEGTWTTQKRLTICYQRWSSRSACLQQQHEGYGARSAGSLVS